MLEDDAAWGSAIQSAEYWEARYARDAAGSGAGNFEWYVSYEQVEGLLEACLRRGGSVLEIGCGNSELALGLHRAGFDVTATDYAKGQIDLLNAQHADLVGGSPSQSASPRLRFEATDCRELESAYGPESFDAVVDKACLDSMLSGDADTAKLLPAGIRRIEARGSLVVISHASPEGDLGTFCVKLF